MFSRTTHGTVRNHHRGSAASTVWRASAPRLGEQPGARRHHARPRYGGGLLHGWRLGLEPQQRLSERVQAREQERDQARDSWCY